MRVEGLGGVAGGAVVGEGVVELEDKVLAERVVGREPVIRFQ